MTSTDMIRWGGPAAMLGGLLFVVYAVGTNFIGESHALYHTLNAPPNALLAVGIVGLYLYARQRGRFGKLGTVGFYLCAIVFALEAVGGVAIIAAETMFGGAFVDALDIIHPMVLLLMVGTVLFGVAALRAGTLPRGGALLLVVVPLLMIGSLFLLGGPEWAFTGGMALFGIGWAWLGYGLLSRQRGESIQARPAVR